MKKILVVLFAVISSFTFSQNYDVNVTDHTGIVGKMHHAAIAVVINLDKSDVGSSWKKELKNCFCHSFYFNPIIPRFLSYTPRSLMITRNLLMLTELGILL